MDTLECWPFPGVDTLLKAFERNCELTPNAEFLGTRTKDTYEWVTYKQVKKQAHNFAAGCVKLGLIPNVQAEGKTWRFMGI